MFAIQNHFFAGEIAEAQKITEELSELNAALFCETSPMPVKYAAELLGICKGELRLPLVEIEEQSKRKLKKH